MKIIIWQQFSSNHSGIFRAVGAFESAEKAQEALEWLQGILKRILGWRYSQPNPRYDIATPSAIEQTIADEMNVEWSEGLDWLDTEALDTAIHVFDRAVLLRNPDQTWNTSSVPRALLTAAAQVSAGWDLTAIENRDEITWITVDITAKMHDHQTLEEALKSIEYGVVHIDNDQLAIRRLPVDEKVFGRIIKIVRETCIEVAIAYQAVDVHEIKRREDT